MRLRRLERLGEEQCPRPALPPGEVEVIGAQPVCLAALNATAEGAVIVVLCGPAWSWVAPRLFKRLLHITWTASLGVGGLAAGAAGTLEAAWHAHELPVRYY